MMTMQKMEKKLQKADWKQAVLYLVCNFISLMLITAYSAMMFSPTVQEILPQGGDSRKQMYAIFVLALFGCVVFTAYAASLFFRKKSRQLGILMALGASGKRLAPGLFREVLALSGISSFVGILAGIPFVLLLWNGFRFFIVDTKEMVFRFDFRFLLVSAGFFVLVVLCACVLAFMYLRRTNILDVVQEEHKNEPVKEPGRWCGPVGILLLLTGAVTGYYSGYVYMAVFDAYYPPDWLNLLYAPLFIGLYMIMLHTVVHGWGCHKKCPYKNIVSRSMMKFQGKQTVNSLLVSTVLIAGGCFGIFFLPMMISDSTREINSRQVDYAYYYRADQKGMPDETSVAELGKKYDVSITNWRETPYLILACDGTVTLEGENNKAVHQYYEQIAETRCYSESSFELLTGIRADVATGTYMGLTNKEESHSYSTPTDTTLFTNMSTMEKLPTKFAGYLHYGLMVDKTAGAYVLDDGDYAILEKGITPEWSGVQVYFDIDGKDNYAFAQELLYALADATGDECAVSSFYDRIGKKNAEDRGEIYFEGYEDSMYMDMSDPDAAEFRMNWAYMPKIRILDSTDFMKSFAVFLMTFLFIAIVCFTAAIVISYTRCQAIVLNNRYIFDDLKRLGASPAFLTNEVRRQCSIVFKIPAVIGMAIMALLYMMILYANDGKITGTEITGFLLCLGVIALIAVIVYGVFSQTVRRMKKQLGIGR